MVVIAFGIVAIVLILALTTTWFIATLVQKKNAQQPFDAAVKVLEEKIGKIPDITVNKVVGRANVERGSVGELVAFLRLKADYDKIIPFNDVVDFICIRFPRDGVEGALDFIDIKTGQARLSKDQMALKAIISDKLINFKKVTLTMDDLK
jgi:hypothetical protein